MRISAILVVGAMIATACGNANSGRNGIAKDGSEDNVKTTFQTSRGWKPTLDNRADAVMVYGVGGNPSDREGAQSFEERAASWRERGYTVHFMTGIAWGEYRDYFTGEWDGAEHFDEGQVTAQGDTIWHGPMVPYIVPTENFLNYIKQKHIRRAIDAGAEEIFIEEPEFWARGGYSEAFKREWENYYGFPWRPQDSSPENTYLANKLKYHLYYNALDEVLSYAKEYGRSIGKDIKCYVATHSLINYSQWQIVSPEASLSSLPCVDGYIAQVWTGTSRVPNYFDGRMDERVFETAYLEYGSMASMTAPTGRKMFFLTDPVEDRVRDWEDYRRNYEATFTAQLLYPGIADYEIMPWPERIYEGLYRVSADSEQTAHIPADYATQMQVMIGALGRMPLSDNQVNAVGSQAGGAAGGVAVLMANSLMFQSFPEHKSYTDPQLSNFFGLALPLLKRGVPVRTVHIENLGYPEALEGTKVLLMSYSNMKPLDPEAHTQIAEWVRGGGVLLYCGRDNDPFRKVMEWWNTGGNRFASPSDHLFSLMGIPAGAPEGKYSFGSGKVCILRSDPKEFVMQEGGDAGLIGIVSRLYRESTGEELSFSNSFYLERGPYDIAAVMRESVSNEPLHITGTLVDLYDPTLPVMGEKLVYPGECALLVDLDRMDRREPCVVASAGREYDVKARRRSFSFTSKGPLNTSNVTRVLLPGKPVSVQIDAREVLEDGMWDEESGTLLLRFDNNPDGVTVSCRWK